MGMWSIAHMRAVGWILAAALPCCLLPAGCNSNCSPAFDTTLVFTTSVLATGSNAVYPLCSKCGGAGESPSYECQSTCPVGADAGEAVAEGDGGAGGNTMEDNVQTCIVESCATAVTAPHVTCETACAAIYPGATVTSCSLGSGTVTCNVHEPETCH